MSVEDRVSNLEKEIQQIKDNKRDVWDKISIIATMLVPLTIAGVGGAYTYVSQSEKEVVARIQAASDSKIKQAELVSKFFEPLTGPEGRKKEVAIESLLVAAPDYGPVLVRLISKPSTGAESQEFAKQALNERRNLLIRELYSDSGNRRKDAYSQLITSWSRDDALIGALISYGTNNTSSENGIYNTLVLLSHMDKDVIQKRKSEILAFADLVESNGPKTKERAEKLRSRL